MNKDNLKKAIQGAVIASAAAGLFACAASNTTSAVQAEAGAQGGEEVVHCGGVNGCKGQGSCAGAGNSCKAQNNCKGHGWTEMSPADCEAQGGTVMSMDK